jgi:hypothetical protein
MRGVIELSDRGWFPHDDDDLPIELPSPLEQMERLAKSIAQRRSGSVESLLDEGRHHLQRVAVHELHRLAGELVAEVSLAETPRARLGRAIAGGAKLLEARPPDHVMSQLADLDAFVARCRAVCRGLVSFVAASINAALIERGEEPMANAEPWIEECAQELHLALAGTVVDGIDRKAQLALLFAKTLKLPKEEETGR